MSHGQVRSRSATGGAGAAAGVFRCGMRGRRGPNRSERAGARRVDALPESVQHGARATHGATDPDPDVNGDTDAHADGAADVSVESDAVADRAVDRGRVCHQRAREATVA